MDIKVTVLSWPFGLGQLSDSDWEVAMASKIMLIKNKTKTTAVSSYICQLYCMHMLAITGMHTQCLVGLCWTSPTPNMLFGMATVFALLCPTLWLNSIPTIKACIILHK